MVPPSLAQSAHFVEPLKSSCPANVRQTRPDLLAQWLSTGGSGTIFGKPSAAGYTNPGLSAPSGMPTLSVIALISVLVKIITCHVLRVNTSAGGEVVTNVDPRAYNLL